MRMYHALLVSSLLVLAKAGIKFPGRKESILGKTYFNNEKLLNTEVDDVKPFIADFTLPETGLEATGSNKEIHEQFVQYNAENSNDTKLIVTWNLYANGPRHNVLNLQHLNTINAIEELWLLINDARIETNQFLGSLLINVTRRSFSSLKKLHIIALDASSSEANSEACFEVYVPNELNDLFLFLDVFHIRRLELHVAKQSELDEVLDCLTSNLPLTKTCRVSRLANDNDVMRCLAFQGSVWPFTNIGWNFINYNFKKLRYLQITGRIIQNLPHDVHTTFPSLQVLDVSYDMENTDIAWEDKPQTFANVVVQALLFHPSLQLFISVNNLQSLDTSTD